MNQTPGKASKRFFFRGSTALMTVLFIGAAGTMVLTGPEPVAPVAQAQTVSLSVQFRTALQPHGRWDRHERWGEVWIPADRPRDWRPYTAGQWIYTDEWGWYWDSDEDFGWVTYHYGRWVLDPRMGWVWIPGNEWGPAWVQWRRSDRHVGWAPLPPRQVVYEYDADPEFWIFVNFNNFGRRDFRTVILPPQERVVLIRETVIVNRTIYVDRGPRVAFNPGIAPTIVAARIGEPVRVRNVRPAVIRGTVGVTNAVELSAEETVKRTERVRSEIVEGKETIEAAEKVPPPEALKKGEVGRVGERAPRVAKEAQIAPGTVTEKDAPEPEIGTKAKPDSDAKIGPDTKKVDPEMKKAEPETKVDPDTKKPEPETKAKSEPETKAKPEPETKAKPAPETKKAEPETKAKPGPETKAKPEPETKAKPAPETKKAEPETKTQQQKAPEPKAQPRPQKAPEPKAQPQQQKAPEPKAQPQQQKAPEPKDSPQPKAPANDGAKKGKKGDD